MRPKNFLTGTIYAPQEDAPKIARMGIRARWCTKDKRFERCNVPLEAAAKLTSAGYRYELKHNGQTVINDGSA